MKFVKSISLFFLYPVVMLGIGFFAGVRATHFFYPGVQDGTKTQLEQENSGRQVTPELDSYLQSEKEKITSPHGESETDKQTGEGKNKIENKMTPGTGISQASSSGETLCVDTEYVLEETDIVNGSVVETVWKLPDKYIGMNRKQFLEAMESYETFPPLSEMERGFVDLEVLSFSRERVVVQMNYQYLQPGNSFYLAVRDNEVVVYLEDMETIYINTGIELTSLPEDMQMEIMQMLWIEDEESLYDFLETYSS